MEHHSRRRRRKLYDEAVGRILLLHWHRWIRVRCHDIVLFLYHLDLNIRLSPKANSDWHNLHLQCVCASPVRILLLPLRKQQLHLPHRALRLELRPRLQRRELRYRVLGPGVLLRWSLSTTNCADASRYYKYV